MRQASKNAEKSTGGGGNGSKHWSEDDLQLLIKAVNLFPLEQIQGIGSNETSLQHILEPRDNVDIQLAARYSKLPEMCLDLDTKFCAEKSVNSRVHFEPASLSSLYQHTYVYPYIQQEASSISQEIKDRKT